LVYKVNTGSCYDSVVERNLNTGLPKKVSFITDNQIQCKLQTNRTSDKNLPFGERKLKQTTAEQRPLSKQQNQRSERALKAKQASSYRDRDDENAVDARKIMFGLVSEHAQKNDETRQPGFIKAAQLFQTQETKDNIAQLEREAKEMFAFTDSAYLQDDAV